MRVLCLLVSFLFISPLFAETASTSVNVQLEKRWGLLIGDEVNMTVILPIASTELDKSSLPQTEKRYGPWLYLKRHQLSDNQLTLQFQVINVPRENRQVQTPELTLRTVTDGWLTIPPQTIQIGSFLTALEIFTPDDIQSDKPVTYLSSASEWQQLRWALIGFLLSVLVLVLWQFGFRIGPQRPFAKAQRALFKQKLLGRKQAESASRILHQAFNESAERVVVESQLVQLYQQATWLKPLSTEIERFYQQSSAQFFAPHAAKTHSFESVYKLAKACRAKERDA